MRSTLRTEKGVSLKILRSAGTVAAVTMVSLGLVAPSTAYASASGLRSDGPRCMAVSPSNGVCRRRLLAKTRSPNGCSSP